MGRRNYQSINKPINQLINYQLITNKLINERKNTTGKKSKERRFSRFIYERKRTGQRDESMNERMKG